MAGFYEKLSYSFGNEDWHTEQCALQMTPEDRVICITASGDRPLNLLSSECKQIVSIDANPVQNYLLNLKSVALLELEYEEYLALMGIHDHPKRDVLFEYISDKLDPSSKSYWNQRKNLLKKGIIYQGATERLCYGLSRAIQLFRGEKVQQLMEFDHLEMQKEFLMTSWETPLWKKCFDIVLHPFITKLFMKDPGLYLAVAPSLEAGSYIYERMHSFLRHALAKESPLLSLLLTGRVGEEALPPCLTKEGVERIRPQLDRLSFETANVVSYLESAQENSFDCFSLSDVVSYLKRQDFERLIKAILRTAKTGARFCIRQFLSGYEIPPEFTLYFKRDMQLEEKLQREERCFVYRFLVGKIDK